MFLNAEVAPNVVTSNGYPVKLSESAVSAIKSVYKGVPLLVKLGYPCGSACCNAWCAFACSCKSQGCCAVRPLPVIHDGAHFHEIWFGKQSEDSMCKEPLQVCLANMCFCNIPTCVSLLTMNQIWLAPEEVTFLSVDNRPTLQFALPANLPPQYQAMHLGMMVTMGMQ